MLHSAAQLALANACHSGMDPAERHSRMRAVAEGQRDAYWLARLGVAGDSASQADAMAMLDDYESRPGGVIPVVLSRASVFFWRRPVPLWGGLLLVAARWKNEKGTTMNQCEQMLWILRGSRRGSGAVTGQHPGAGHCCLPAQSRPHAAAPGDRDAEQCFGQRYAAVEGFVADHVAPCPKRKERTYDMSEKALSTE